LGAFCGVDEVAPPDASRDLTRMSGSPTVKGSDRPEATVTAATVSIIWAAVIVLAFVGGRLHGRYDSRSRERVWCDGYAAGLKKADELWPTVNRWEMR